MMHITWDDQGRRLVNGQLAPEHRELPEYGEVPLGCTMNPLSSRVCERGTRCCNIRHGKVEAALVALPRWRLRIVDHSDEVCVSTEASLAPDPEGYLVKWDDVEAIFATQDAALVALVEQWKAIVTLKQRDIATLRSTGNDGLADIFETQASCIVKMTGELVRLLGDTSSQEPKETNYGERESVADLPALRSSGEGDDSDGAIGGGDSASERLACAEHERRDPAHDRAHETVAAPHGAERVVLVGEPDFWRCLACGCLWRDNHDGTVSLASAKQKSCDVCEGSTPATCEPLFKAWAVPDAVEARPFRMPQYDILEAMNRYGGGFVRQLAAAFRAADPQNQRKLAAAFDDYWHQYDDMAASSSASVVPKCRRCFGTGYIPSETCNDCVDCQDTCPECKGTGF